MTDGSGVLRSVSDITLVSRRIKLRTQVDLSALPNDGIEIDLAAAVLNPAGVENGGRLTASFADLIGFERKFDDLGHGSALSSC
jgi:hypothetical protein